MAEDAANAGGAPVLPLSHSVRVYATFEVLPEACMAFLREAAERSFFHGSSWYRAVLQRSGPRTDETRIFVAECQSKISAMLIARERKRAGRLRNHMLLGASHGPYALSYVPLLDAQLGTEGLGAIVREIARAFPPYHVMRFDCLDAGTSEVAVFAAAWRAARMPVQRFRTYRYYFEKVQGLSRETYLARQPQRLQAILGRLQRRVERSGRYRFETVAGGPELKPALIAYALVDLQSPQDAESYPDCIPEIIAAAAETGVLRLGFCFVDNEPAAAQAWIVNAGRATLWRSHQVQKFARFCARPALTLEMIRHLLTVDCVQEIDFGPDDGAVSHGWHAQSRERMGLLVFNPRTAKGLIAAGRHIGGHGVMSAARFLMRGLRRALAQVHG
jgi:hypothetical protein